MDVREAATSWCGNEEEEEGDPAKKIKSEKEVRNVNAFGHANNGNII